MADIKIILISSVHPEPTSAGQVVLYRHLVGQKGIEVEIYGNEPAKSTLSSSIRRLVGRFGQTRFHRLSEDFWALWKARWLDSSLPRSIAHDGRTVVLTVAHGDVCMAALRFAKNHKLPLVTFFHDWWPDIPDVHNLFRRCLEKNFQRLYQGSTVALCVSEEMKLALGEHPSATVLPPIPKKTTRDSVLMGFAPDEEKRFKIYYFGNLFEYGAMLAKALKELNGHGTIRLEVRGANPNWPQSFREDMRKKALWKDFAPRAELDGWLNEASAFLVAMVFDQPFRRRMETSFPSKLIEFAQLGKPLVIWGPEYGSAVQWARQGNRALCITDPNPAALREALESLAVLPEERLRLSAAASHAAQTDFNPDKIQAQFLKVLRNVVSQRI